MGKYRTLKKNWTSMSSHKKMRVGLKGKEKVLYKVFNGKKYTLYQTGNKTELNNYISAYNVPDVALYRVVALGKGFGLYLHHKKRK